MADELTLTVRLLALFDHLGIDRAHVATQMPGDVADLAASHPGRIAGLVLAVPARLDPAPFAALATRLLLISGETGITREAATRAAVRLGQARLHILPGYDAPGWADVAADRTSELLREMTGFLSAGTPPAGRPPAMTASTPRAEIRREGIHAGLTYHIEGDGPALILLPFFLAASQWTPVIPGLARHFTVIRIGGAHVGGVAALEDRARAPTYRAMFGTLVDHLGAKSGNRILDVGCGSGALDRLLAARLGPGARIDAVDVNTFLLGEAATLARAEGFAGNITFSAGSAEALPFPDASFDCAFSVTVLEECNADLALAELTRVVRPGGRVGVVVRAIDMAQWWSFELPEALRARANTPPQSVGKDGIADASLYRRILAAGLVDLVPFPALVTLDRPSGPIWRYREDHMLSQLSAAETAEWQARRNAAARAGTLFQANALHCAVASKPAN